MKRERDTVSWPWVRAARTAIVLVLIAVVCAAIGGRHPGGWPASARGQETPPPVHDPQRADPSEKPSPIRAYHGSIFFARVDALARETAEPRPANLPPSFVQHYLVTVDRVLVGDASGQVPITYFDALEFTADNNGFGPLRIGERYLLFAGFSFETGEYLVGAGTGTILVTSAEQEEQLARGYAPLILDAEAHEQLVIAGMRKWIPARAARRGVMPIATLYPTEGPPGSRPRVFGALFRDDGVTIRVGEEVMLDEVDIADGSFRKRIVIPLDAPTGPFPIVITGEDGIGTEVTFNVPRR